MSGSLNEALQLEKQILERSKKNPEMFIKLNGEAHNLSRKLRDVMFDEMVKRGSKRRDLREMERRLWKTCFYVFIEMFRKDLSLCDEHVQEKDLKAKIDTFQTFLSEAESFYRKLAERKISSHSEYRCLVFLGDIARYKQLHSFDYKNNKMTKTRFKEAEEYYRRALRLDVSFGSAHNQLAVLATYRDANVVATYHYIRALYVYRLFHFKFCPRNISPSNNNTDTVARHLRQLTRIYEPCSRER